MFVDYDIEDFCWQPYGNVYPEKGRLADVVGECLDEELESWVRCLRIRELVGKRVTSKFNSKKGLEFLHTTN